MSVQALTEQLLVASEGYFRRFAELTKDLVLALIVVQRVVLSVPVEVHGQGQLVLQSAVPAQLSALPDELSVLDVSVYELHPCRIFFNSFSCNQRKSCGDLEVVTANPLVESRRREAGN
jgi:hypothetical protein